MITMQLRLVRQEQPSWTNNECLREARRRSEREMVAAADAIEARQRLQDARGRGAAGHSLAPADRAPTGF